MAPAAASLFPQCLLIHSSDITQCLLLPSAALCEENKEPNDQGPERRRLGPPGRATPRPHPVSPVPGAPTGAPSTPAPAFLGMHVRRRQAVGHSGPRARSAVGKRAQKPKQVTRAPWAGAGPPVRGPRGRRGAERAAGRGGRPAGRGGLARIRAGGCGGPGGAARTREALGGPEARQGALGVQGVGSPGWRVPRVQGVRSPRGVGLQVPLGCRAPCPQGAGRRVPQGCRAPCPQGARHRVPPGCKAPGPQGGDLRVPRGGGCRVLGVQGAGSPQGVGHQVPPGCRAPGPRGAGRQVPGVRGARPRQPQAVGADLLGSGCRGPGGHHAVPHSPPSAARSQRWRTKGRAPHCPRRVPPPRALATWVGMCGKTLGSPFPLCPKCRTGGLALNPLL